MDRGSGNVQGIGDQVKPGYLLNGFVSLNAVSLTLLAYQPRFYLRNGYAEPMRGKSLDLTEVIPRAKELPARWLCHADARQVS